MSLVSFLDMVYMSIQFCILNDLLRKCETAAEKKHVCVCVCVCVCMCVCVCVCSGSSSLYRQSSQTTADSVDDLETWTDLATAGGL